MSPRPAVRRLLDRLDEGPPLICGIVNVTPDSYFATGRSVEVGPAVRHALRLAADGADVLDVGGESTRPGAARPSVGEELDRVVPVLEVLADLTDVPLSVDTSRPEVMDAAIRAGAAMVNDVRGLEAPGAVETAGRGQVVVCVSHRRGEPATMQRDPHYDDVVAEVTGYLRARADACSRAGLGSRHVIVDPGFGFGKTLAHNLSLLGALDRLTAEGRQVMVGMSRKSMLGAVTGRPVHERLAGSIAAATLALAAGARLLRVHDVAATWDAVQVWQAVERTRLPANHDDCQVGRCGRRPGIPSHLDDPDRGRG